MEQDEEWFETIPLPNSYIVRPRTTLQSPLYPINKIRDDICIKDSPLTGLDYLYNIRNYIWNRETNRFCGRDGLDWAKLGCYYSCFLFILGVISSSFVIVYILLLDKKTPRRLGNESALVFDNGINPGLGFRPQLYMDRTLLQWRTSRKTGHQSVAEMVDNVHQWGSTFGLVDTHHQQQIDCSAIKPELLINYFRQGLSCIFLTTDVKPEMVDNVHQWGSTFGLVDTHHQQQIDCSAIKPELLINYFRQGLSCIFLTTDVKPGPNPCSKPKNYGYNKGRPCVALKINRVFGWIPEPYQTKDEVPLEIRHLWQPIMKNFVLIKCFGQYPTDQDLIYQVDHISILGNKAIGGIPTYYFPFLNQPGYRQPFVWAQFVKVESNVLLNIICRAYAKNIRQSTNIEDMTGAVHFEIFFQ
ncbi:unnamed protein product [Adineta steineri]|uniref:Sodium/potassium-transporting ATPase subunit beta-1 n=1 Tax=Adineta steineri TaxID=433720 RepID=A0A814MU47_9BILA|nr:unnamed protein product [Adineta steineri]